MILLIILGIAAYFILPFIFLMWLLERNNPMIFKWDIDVHLVGLTIILIELALFIQIFVWIYL